jgi:nitronate monooxygenase
MPDSPASPADALPATPLTRDARIRVPFIGGAMYPCSNPELVAAVSAAGGIGVIQPISLTYAHRREFREGIREIVRLAGGAPVGLNALIEASSKTYHDRMVRWVEIALEEGVRFFVTSLGNPKWVVDRVSAEGGIVYHDITERKWALKGRDAGVHGLIGVNDRAGGHTGRLSAPALLEAVGDLGLPVVAAGGAGSGEDFADLLAMGYAGVQVGTRLIATQECTADERYKQAIVQATASDIVLTERLTGVPVAVLRTPYVERLGTTVGPLARAMFRGRRTKHWIRTFYALRSLRQLRRSSVTGGESDYWQAGRSVATITAITSVAEVVATCEAAWTRRLLAG